MTRTGLGATLAAAQFSLAAALGGCAPPRPAATDHAVLAGRGEPLRAFLRDLETLAGTPLANAAARARRNLDGCDRVEGRAATAAGLAASLRCPAPGDADRDLEALRGDDDLFFAVPVGGVRLTGRGRFAAGGGVTVDVEIPKPAGNQAFWSLLPRAAGLGSTVLSGRDVLIQARLGSDRGLDLASMIKADGLIDSFYKLRSRIFSKAVLTGVWEVAVYEPGASDQALPLALALEVTNAALGRVAVDEFLDDLGTTWPFHRRHFQVGDAEGECLDDVRVLLDLAPCYVIRGRTLVVGWSSEVTQRALAGNASDELADRSRLLVELERFPAAEKLLTHRAYGERAEARPLVYPWQRAVISGRRDGDLYRVRLELVRGTERRPAAGGTRAAPDLPR